jgi:hypothetical protein
MKSQVQQKGIKMISYASFHIFFSGNQSVYALGRTCLEYRISQYSFFFTYKLYSFDVPAFRIFVHPRLCSISFFLDPLFLKDIKTTKTQSVLLSKILIQIFSKPTRIWDTRPSWSSLKLTVKHEGNAKSKSLEHKIIPDLHTLLKNIYHCWF